jgi:hypothetical protein
VPDGQARSADLHAPRSSFLQFDRISEIASASPKTFDIVAAIAGAAIANLRSRLVPKPPAAECPVLAEKAARERALARAAGTWGGYRACRKLD